MPVQKKSQETYWIHYIYIYIYIFTLLARIFLSRYSSQSSIGSGRSSKQYAVSQQSCCLFHLTHVVYEMGDEWLCNCCFVGCCVQDLFKTVRSALALIKSKILFSCVFQVAKLLSYRHSDSLEKPVCLSKKLDIYMNKNFSFAIYAFPVCMLTYFPGVLPWTPIYVHTGVRRRAKIHIYQLYINTGYSRLVVT